ncbi:MAG TPA: hypothetical protein VN933_17540, partial [Candidatus Eremiobacteraceae bacterium]|nr:hypothetical protein [Candidatus Eremiobacteraceae bacterium]
ATSVTKVEVRWPDGAHEEVTLPSVDRIFAVEESKGVVPSVYDAIAQQNAAAHKTAENGPSH